MLRRLHTLAVALWFGMAVFFTLAGVLIFRDFDDLARVAAAERPMWFPAVKAFDRPPDDFGNVLPDPVVREQGSRAAGVAVSALFPAYYGIQVVCAVVALLTAVALARGTAGVAHRTRLTLAVAALVTVLAGCWLERVVHDLRKPRNDATDALLTANPVTTEHVREAKAARGAFGAWHGFSLLQNFLTLALVTGLTLLLPEASAGTKKAAGETAGAGG